MENTTEVKKVKLSTVYGETVNHTGNNDTTNKSARVVVHKNSLYPSAMMKEVDKNV